MTVRLGAVSRWVVALLLALAIPFVPISFVVTALAAIGLRLRLSSGRAASGEHLFILVLNLLALPFVWSAVFPARPEVAGLTVLGFPWFAQTLRETARGPSVPDDALLPVRLMGRSPTPLLASLGLALAAAALAAGVAEHLVLAIAALVQLAFLAVLVLVSLTRLRPENLTIRSGSARVLARASCEAEAVVEGKKRVTGRIHLTVPAPWVHVAPPVCEVGGESVTLNLQLTPPLAGSGPVDAHLVWVDPWGLTGATLTRTVAHLRVIPRAAYAAWFARRYLETSRAAGPTAVITPEAPSQRGARRGLDYYGARHYEPGDALRDILWKQTIKMNQFVVKDRRDDMAQVAIIAARLAGRDPDEVDEIAYHVLMTALTLAQDGVPAAFAAFAPDGRTSATEALSPGASVRHALRLVEQIRVVLTPRRILHPVHPARLRRSTAEPVRRLAGILDFELRALQYRARTHPAVEALTRSIGRIRTPAVVVVISPSADDAEVLNVALERLGAKGYQRIDLLAASS